MGTIVKQFTFSAGATIIAAEHNTNFDTLYNEINGSIENVNISASAAIANSKLNLAAIAQDVAMSSSQFLLAKGADIASATSITLGSDGNYFDITGTTTIETITILQAGTLVWLHIDDGLTLSHAAGNLQLKSGDLKLASEQMVCLASNGTNWILAGGQVATGLAIPSSVHGDLIFRGTSTWDRLAAGTSGQFLKTQGASANVIWDDLPSNNFSNVLFSFVGEDGAATGHGQTAFYVAGTSTTPSVTTDPVNLYKFTSDNAGSLLSIFQDFKWKKFAGVSTITVHGRAWSDQATGFTITVDVGGQTGTSSTITSTSPAEFTSFTVDVSSLSDGTEYDVKIQGQRAGFATTLMCISQLILWGS